MRGLRHFDTPLLPTPFDARTAPLNRLHRWGAWAGYRAALCFGDVAMEYSALRNAATLYDLCPMQKYAIRGPEAADYLNRLLIRNAGRLSVGGVQYTAWCDDAGQVMDDGTLFRLGPDDYRLWCQELHLPWLLDSADGFDVTVQDVSEALAGLALQGPCAASVLTAAGVDVAGLRPFRCLQAVLGARVMISRTGFTGDLGYEVWCDAGDALAVWDHLMAAGAIWGLRPIGTEALDMARIEAGFIVAGQDFVPAETALREDRVRSPCELGLDWLIDWDKGHFTGRRALLAQRAAGGGRWALAALEVAGNVSAEGSILYRDRKREAGFVTSALWSPVTKRNIALAQIERRHLGASLWVEIYALRELQYAKLMVRVQVVKRPFFVNARRVAVPPGRV